MPVRGILRSPVVAGVASKTNAPFHVDSDDNIPYINPAGTGSTMVPLVLGIGGVTGGVMAAGSGVLVSGVATVATGLGTVKGFMAQVLSASGTFATGVTEVSNLCITSITTGSVVVQGIFNSFATGAATASVSGTTSFRWVAFGTAV